MIEQAMEYVNLTAQAVLAITILATLIVRFTPSAKDDAAVGAISEKIKSFLAYFPTLGKNPHTKALEETLKEIEKK